MKKRKKALDRNAFFLEFYTKFYLLIEASY